MSDVLVGGLTFPEAPRWRDGTLWFSDFYSHRVLTVDLDGRLETVVEVPQRPSGLGWRPDGTLLIVSMLDRQRGWGKLVSARGTIQAGLSGVDVAQEARMLGALELAPESDMLWCSATQ